MPSPDSAIFESDFKPIGRQKLPGQVVLVMQGGGAQGAYQGGVYQAAPPGEFGSLPTATARVNSSARKFSNIMAT